MEQICDCTGPRPALTDCFSLDIDATEVHEQPLFREDCQNLITSIAERFSDFKSFTVVVLVISISSGATDH